MQYKVLALDLDGTLTNNAKVITPRTKAALQAAADRGVRIVLASGRPTVGIEPLAKELELDRRGGCILSYNGGKIIDCKTGETLVQHEFPPELIDPVCTFARYWNVMPLTYDAKGIVTEDAANPYVGEEARINKIPARQVENLPAEIQWPINKLLLVGDPVDMPHVEELMQQKFAGKLSIYRSAPFFIETMPLGVEKIRLAGAAAEKHGPWPRKPDGLRRWLERPAHDPLCGHGRCHGQCCAGSKTGSQIRHRR